MTVSVSKITGVRQKHANKCLLLTCFCPFQAENPPRWSAGGLLRMPELMNAGLLYKAGYCLESIQKATTPPYLGSKKCLYPHNFSHQKSRKKSPWQDWKNFGKNLRENVSGKEKAPSLVERGQGVLKYERIVWAKIVELFVITRWEFFHFVFVP